MNLRPCVLLPFVLTLLALPSAHADPLTDLRTLLARQPAGMTPLKAQVELKSVNRIGEGKELEESSGEAVAQIEDGPQGLRLSMPRELLQRAEREDLARAADPKAKTPALTALKDLTPLKLRELTTAASRLGQLLDRAKLTGQKNEDWAGKPATRLSFELERRKLAGKEAEFVKEYKGTLDLWIGADGLPLAAKTRQVFTGRAYMFFSFEQVQESEVQFGQVGERLVLLKSEERNLGSGTAGKSDFRTSWVLKPAA